jgi:formamidopyrimidine-DNA glycosylase
MIYIFPTAAPCQKIFGKLGPDPLSNDFNTRYLKEKLINRKVPIKNALMDNTLVVGIGNIYAAESLFLAKISPQRQSCILVDAELNNLVESIKNVLEKAILAGGTTIKDFVNGDNKPGYFRQELLVYARKGEKCTKCNGIIIRIKQSGRASFYCSNCQR